MRCPFCHHPDDRVVDSREAREGDAIRRRRECLACGRRFTTYERIDAVMPLIVKKDGRREPFDATKVLAGLHKACEKRPVSADAIEEVAAEVERRVQEAGAREVPSSVVGEAIMESLKGLDDVAYVRFASVYKSFRDIDEFMTALESIVKERGGGPKR
jgi:transcriptional repressor NrdR